MSTPNDRPEFCEYFALCFRTPVAYYDHPIGPVHTCARCGDQMGIDCGHQWHPYPETVTAQEESGCEAGC